MTIKINGMAHVILTVSQFDAARAFYQRLLPEFGMKVVHDGEKLFYCVGARTAIGIEPSDSALAGDRFVQQRVGLHHLCLRARSREDVDKCAALDDNEFGSNDPGAFKSGIFSQPMPDCQVDRFPFQIDRAGARLHGNLNIPITLCEHREPRHQPGRRE